MNGQILFIGLDVDDNAYHGHALCVDNSMELDFECKPNVGALSRKLSEFKERGYELKICYEATYLGFSLSRDLLKRGFSCEVIAPSLIPRKPGERVKTDRIDAKKLATYYMKGELTVVHIPGKEEESIRDLVRSRGFLRDQTKRTKLHILSICRRMGLQYRTERVTSYWTQKALRAAA
jgi:transposase